MDPLVRASKTSSSLLDVAIDDEVIYGDGDSASLGGSEKDQHRQETLEVTSIASSKHSREDLTDTSRAPSMPEVPMADKKLDLNDLDETIRRLQNRRRDAQGTMLPSTPRPRASANLQSLPGSQKPDDASFNLDEAWGAGKDEPLNPNKMKKRHIVLLGIYCFLVVAFVTLVVITRLFLHVNFAGVDLLWWFVWIAICLAVLPGVYFLVSGILWMLNKFKTFRRYLFYFARDVHWHLTSCVWLVVVLVVWYFLIYEVQTNNSSYNCWYVTSTIWLLLATSILFLFKQLLLNVVRRSLENTAFYERIRAALFAEHILRMLESYLEHRSRSGTSPSASDLQHHWRDIVHVDRFFKKMMRSAPDATVKSMIHHYHNYLFEGENISREEVVTLADRLFDALLSSDGIEYLDAGDFKMFPYRSAKRVVALFDRDNNGRIYRREMQASLLQIFRERRLLARALKDTNSLTAQLNMILIVLLLIILLFVALAVYGVNTTTFYTSLSGIILAYAFVFGPSLSVFFKCFIFVFVMHSFDVGDSIYLNSCFVSVADITINYTMFLQGGQLIYYPNTVLSTMPIYNLTRSKDPVFDCLSFLVDYRTPPEKLHEFELKVRDFFIANGDAFRNDFSFTVMDANVAAKTLSINICFRGHEPGRNLSDRRNKRRTVVYFAMKKIMTEVGLSFTLSMMPVRVDASRLPSRLQNVF